MYQIGRFVEDYSWLFKLVIGVLFVFWAGQMGHYALDHIKKEREKQSKRDIKWEQEVEYKCRLFADEFVKEANIGLYTPDRYYKDLARLDTKKYELSGDLFFVSGNISYARNHARGLFHNYLGKYHPSKGEISKAAEKYSNWLKEVGASGEEYRSVVNSISPSEKLNVSSNYLWILFKRGMLPSILLYLIRMIGRRGILETVLADKKKFAFAILLWPFYIFKYPFNVIREIRVEAELRRIGKAFRSLTINEHELIREIASSKNYKIKLEELRIANLPLIKRGLALALLATMLAGIAGGTAIAKIDDLTRGDPVEISMSYDSVSKDIIEYHHIDIIDIWISDSYDFVHNKILLSRQSFKYKRKVLSGFFPDIFHVPLKNLYFTVNITIKI